MIENSAIHYWVWGIDNVAYGPVELPELVKWIKAQHVTSADWIFRDDTRAWQRARELAELAPVLKAESGRGADTSARSGLNPSQLRRIKILADLPEDQLTSLLRYAEVVRVPAHKTVFSQGDPGDAMFLVLEGEVRARVMVGGRESTLATLETGECFGEISVLDQGPRSADVLANTDAVLLKVSAATLRKLFEEAPALAAPLLMGLGRLVVSRLRVTTKRYQDSIHFARAATADKR